MRHALRLLALCLIAACFVQSSNVDRAQQFPGEEEEIPKPIEFKKEELVAAGKYLKSVGGERVMLLNGLRYLIVPGYEPPLMKGRAYVPCALPPFYAENDRAMELLESLRLLVIIESGMPLNETVERDIVRFLNTETRRVDDSLANYAIPMALCVAATRDKRIKHTKLLKEKAEDLMDLAMNARDVTASDSPLIKREFVEPMWFANHMWRALMARCSGELGIKFNEIVWKTNMMDLSGACLKTRGWTSELGGEGSPDNDLNSNLLAVTAVSLILQAPDNLVETGGRRSLEKRLKYMPDILRRLESDFPDEKRNGGRLALIRTFRDDFAPKRMKWADWYAELLELAIKDLEPTGYIESKHGLTNAMGLDVGMAPRHARKAAETGLSCLALCGGLWHDPDLKKPLEGMSQGEIDATMQSLSILHAAYLPPLKKEDQDEEAIAELPLDERVEIAIERGCQNLEKTQLAGGGFTAAGAFGRGAGREYEVAMCLAALIHGDRKQNHSAVQQALSYLTTKLGGGIPETMTIYEIGMILAGYQAYFLKNSEDAGMFKVKSSSDYGKARMNTWASIPQGHRAVIESLTKCLTDGYVGGEKGGWGYSSHGSGHSDNSCSQFGMLGYKAASILGATTDIKIFENEARRLIAQYGAPSNAETVVWRRYDKDGDYESIPFTQPGWNSSIKAGGWSYGCYVPMAGVGSPSVQYNGTGMMELAMARDEMILRNALPSGMRILIDMRIFGAQAWLADNFYQRTEMIPKWGFRGGASHGLLYNMWAIERGCVTANYPLLKGKVDWYTIMAEGLVAGQAEDGSWGTPHDTAVAILILRKAAPPQPSNPRPKPVVRKPKDPTTGNPKPVVEDEEDPIDPVTGNRKKKKDVTEGEEEEEEEETPPEKEKPKDPITGGPKR